MDNPPKTHHHQERKGAGPIDVFTLQMAKDNGPISTDKFDSNRREFLTGGTLQKEAERTGSAIADELLKAPPRQQPIVGNTIRLSTEAMACDFSVVMNQGAGRHLMTANEALEIIHLLEEQMTVYREDSELSRLNRTAYERPVPVEPQLFQLLSEAKQLEKETEGAFDPTSGPLIALWRRCRQAGRIPHQAEIAEALTHTGLEHVHFDEDRKTIRFDDPQAEFNLGGIGKGYALDRAGMVLSEAGVDDWLLHGGFSSLLSQGQHHGQGGWPVGIRNPLLPHEILGTILLKDRGFPQAGRACNRFVMREKSTGTFSIRAPARRWRACCR